MAHRLLQPTSIVESPYAPDVGTWANKANIRDSGDPPAVDGTDGTFTDITVLSSGPVSAAIRVHSPTVPAGVLLIGMEVDAQVSAFGSGGPAFLSIQAQGEFAPSTLIAATGTVARARYRYFFTNAGRNIGTVDIPVKLVASIGTATLMTVRIYEVGYWITERGRPTRIEG